VEKCIKNFRPAVRRLSESERQAYEKRLEVWREKIGRGRKWGKMREVAPEPVDWWKDQDGASLPDVPFGQFEPQFEPKRQRRAHDSSGATPSGT
jgi:hypothetical protein